MQPARPQSLRRHRPHVPSEQRKRTVQACTQCRTSKKKCRPGPRNQCVSCARTRQACVFESIPTTPLEIHSDKSPARRHRPEIRPSSIPWALIANDVSIQFNETHPENTLEPDHFSLLSGLFRETISARWQQLDANDNTNDLESTSSQRTDNAAGRQNVRRVLLLTDFACRARRVTRSKPLSDGGFRDNCSGSRPTEVYTSSEQ